MNKFNSFLNAKTAKFLLRVLSVCFISVLIPTCDVGLGEAVDTTAPTLSISYPPDSAVIRDWFVIAGSCDDDKLVTSVSVNLTNIKTSESKVMQATVNAGKSWSVRVNEPKITKDDDGNEISRTYPLEDGSYIAYITVYDNSGRSTGPFKHQFEIDNTAPICILKRPSIIAPLNPNTVTGTIYGSNLRLSATVAESHNVSKMSLFGITGAGLTEEKEIIIDEGIDVSDGCELDFARFATGPQTGEAQVRKEKYIELYGEPVLTSDGNIQTEGSVNLPKQYVTSIKIADNAYVYQSPDTKKATISVGNETTKIYRYDDVYQKVMGQGTGALGLTAPQLIANMSGKASDMVQTDNEGLKTVKEFMESNALDTETNKLKFTLDPQVRPTYTCVLETVDKNTAFANAAANFTSRGSTSSTVTAEVNAFVGGDPLVVPTTITMWLKLLSEADFADLNKAVRDLESAVHNKTTPVGWWKIAVGKGGESAAKVTVSSAALGSEDIAELNGGKRLAIKNGDYYLVALTGTDVGGNELTHDALYGFTGIQNSAPPSIQITEPVENSYLADSDLPAFAIKGNVSSENKIDDITITVTAIDEANSGNKVWLFATEDRDENAETTIKKLVKTGIKPDSNGDFSVNLSAFTGYNATGYAPRTGDPAKDSVQGKVFQATSARPSVYKYTIEVKATDEANSSSTKVIYATADTVKPVIKISSLEPKVNGASYYDNEADKNIYLNGTVSLESSISDKHLKNVYYRILQGTAVQKVYLPDGSEVETEPVAGKNGWYGLGAETSPEIKLDTTKYTDDGAIKVEILAIDESGNSTTFTSDDYFKAVTGETGSFKIKQATDKPKITVSSADVSVTNQNADMTGSNLFDLSTKKSLDAIITDDEGFASDGVVVTLTNMATNAERSIKYSPNSVLTSYTLSHKLEGSAEGVYKVRITARDKTAESDADENRIATTGDFYISIDKEPPKLTETEYGNNAKTINTALVFAGQASDSNGLRAAGSGAVSIEAVKEGSGSFGTSGKKTWICDVTDINASTKTGSWRKEFSSDSTDADDYLPDGKYSFTITLTDAAGRTHAISRIVTIDTTKPEFGTAAESASNKSNIKPTVKGGLVEDGVTWYNSNTLSVSGTVSDENGIKSVEYVTYTGDFDEENAESYAWEVFALSTPEGAGEGVMLYSGSVPKTGKIADNSTKIALKVTDNAQNVAYNTTLGVFRIDSNEPELVTQTKAGDGTAYTVLVNGDTYITEDSSTVLSNGNEDISFTARVKDMPNADSGSSGIKKVLVSKDGKPITDLSEYQTLTPTQDSTDDTVYIVSGTIAKTYNGSVYARIVDKAGNYFDTTLFVVSKDETPPKLQSWTLLDAKELDSDGKELSETSKTIRAYATDSTKTVYWIHNQKIGSETEHKFVLSGIATDNRAVKSVDLEIFDGPATTASLTSKGENPSLTNEGDVSNGDWKYSFDLSGFTSETAKAVITVIDTAGNTYKSSATDEGQALTFKFDNTKPSGVHSTFTDPKDNIEKDKTFRIGGKENDDTDVGGKYSSGTYGNATTIMIRGFFEESDSGIDQIYYKVVQSEPAEADENAFLDDYKSLSNGSFSALSSVDTRRVPYNTDAGTVAYSNIQTNFLTSISNFKAGKNYLMLVAVDKVGNAALDNTGFYSINVDLKDPSIKSLGGHPDAGEDSAENTRNILVNGKHDIIIEGTVTDEGSVADAVAGFDTINVDDTINVELEVNEKTYSNNASTAALKKISVAALEDAIDDDGNIIPNSKKWKVTVSKDVFADETLLQGDFSVYLTAKDKAGEGNSKTLSVASLNVDKSAPTLSLSSASGTRFIASKIGKVSNTTASGTVSLINGETEFSGTAKDNTALKSIRAYYSTSNSSAAITDSDTLFGTADSASASSWNFTKEVSKLTSLDGTITVLGEDSDGSDQTLYVKFLATDTAENESVYVYEYKISPEKDIPIINISNISSDGGTLKYDTKISGTISDDDGINDSCELKVYEIYGSESDSDKQLVSALPSSISEWSAYSSKGVVDLNKNNGEWSYSLHDKEDGPKQIYFYFKDAVGTEFWSAYGSDFFQPKVKFKEDAAASSSGTAVNFKTDSESPSVNNVEVIAYNSNTDSAEPTAAAETVSSATILGGQAKKYASFVITAADANGIAGLCLDIGNIHISSDASKFKKNKDAAYVTDGDSFVAGADGTSLVWTTKKIDLSALRGTLTASITAFDNSELMGNGSNTFTVDNEPPEFSGVTPGSSSELTGDVEIYGNARDNNGGIGTASVKWLVPTRAQVTAMAALSSDAGIKALNYNWNDHVVDNSDPNNWKFRFDGKYDAEKSRSSEFIYVDGNPRFNEYIEAGTNYYEDIVDGVYTIPVYFMAEDELGNVKVFKDFKLRYNPDGDRPKVTFSYPKASDYKEGENYAVLGGKIRVTGSAEIPLPNNDDPETVEGVYLQIADEAGDFDNAAKNKVTGTYGLTVKTAYEVINEKTGKTISSASMTNALAKDFGFASKTLMDAWWGIPANGKNAWNILLNDDGKLNPISGTNNIKLRAAAVNSKGRMGAWSGANDEINVHIDNNAPTINFQVSQYEESVTEANAASLVPVKTQGYEPDMFLKGDWYLVATILDESGINNCKVDNRTSGFVKIDEEETVDGVRKTGYTLFIPVDKTKSEVSIEISADDADTGGSHNLTQTFDFKIDNTAPSLENLVGNGEALSELEKIQNSGYVFTLGGDSLDEGSGLERVVFYYIRKKNLTNNSISKNVLLDPMIKTSGDDYEDAKIEIDSSITTIPFTQDGTTYELYAYTFSGTTPENDKFQVTGTLNEHIREGGLIYIGGTLRKITDITGSDVKFEPALTDSESATEAKFPIAQVIDSSANEQAADKSKNPFVVERDDGDGMPESFTKNQKTWTWDSSVHSDNMPDGPVTLVILAFDKAGNVSGRSIKTSVSNNAPRVAKLFLATDLNSDTIFQKNEFETYSIVDAEKITDLSELPESYTLDFAATVTDKNGNTTPKYAAGKFTIKDSLAVVPEIVGGNKSVKLVYKVNAANENPVTGTGTTLLAPILSGTTVGTTDPDTEKVSYSGELTEAGSGTSTFTIASQEFEASKAGNKLYAYVLAKSIFGGDGTNKNLSFTFWDETEETTQGSDSQKTVILVKGFDIDQIDGERPRVVVNPFYWKSLTENSIYASSGAAKTGDLKGHIELENDIKDITAITEPLGADPKVSGKITFTGTAFDEHALKTLSFSFTGTSDSATFSGKSMAEYKTVGGVKKWVPSEATIDSEGYEVEIFDAEKDDYGVFGDNAYFNQKGHKVYWKLSIDTEKFSRAAGKDMKLTVTANDGTNSSNTTEVQPEISTGYIPGMALTGSAYYKVTDGTTNKPTYQMDVVPYITGITNKVGNAYKKDSSVFGRSATGSYPVYYYSDTNRETFTVNGFNFGSSPSVSVNGGTATSGTSVQVTNAMTSGGVVVTVGSGTNAVSSLNNVNNNNAKGSYNVESASGYDKYKNYYNRQPNNLNNSTLTDDCKVAVWNISKVVDGDTGVRYPSMRVGSDGTVGFVYDSGAQAVRMNKGGDDFCIDYSFTQWYGTAVAVDSSGRMYGISQNGDSGGTGEQTYGGNYSNSYFYAWNTKDSPDSVRIYSSRTGRYTATTPEGQSYAAYSTGAKKKAIESTWNGTKFNGMRVQNPKIALNGTNAYVVYYDSSEEEIRFRYGGVSGTANSPTFSNALADHGTSAGSAAGYHTLARGTKAGEYSAVGATTDGKAVVVWYSSEDQSLYYTYNTDPTDDAEWTAAVQIDKDFVGWYVDLVVDGENGVHIAYYDASNGDLKYAYVEDYTKPNEAKTMTVDSYLSSGTNISISVKKVGDNYVPYISSFMSSFNKTSYTVRTAWITDGSLLKTASADELKGVDSSDDFTGVWEVMTVPLASTSIPLDYSVGIGIKSNQPILGYGTQAGLETATLK